MKKIARILSVAMLVVMTALVMTACVPSNAEKAKAKLEKAGYTVDIVDLEEENAGVEGAKYQVVAVKTDGEELVGGVYIIYFDSKANAKAWYDENINSINDEEEGYSSVIKGKVVYWGNEQGKKDFE